MQAIFDVFGLIISWKKPSRFQIDTWSLALSLTWLRCNNVFQDFFMHFMLWNLTCVFKISNLPETQLFAPEIDGQDNRPLVQPAKFQGKQFWLVDFGWGSVFPWLTNCRGVPWNPNRHHRWQVQRDEIWVLALSGEKFLGVFHRFTWGMLLYCGI